MSGDPSWAFARTLCCFKVARDTHEFGCNPYVRLIPSLLGFRPLLPFDVIMITRNVQRSIPNLNPVLFDLAYAYEMSRKPSPLNLVFPIDSNTSYLMLKTTRSRTWSGFSRCMLFRSSTSSFSRYWYIYVCHIYIFLDTRLNRLERLDRYLTEQGISSMTRLRRVGACWCIVMVRFIVYRVFSSNKLVLWSIYHLTVSLEIHTRTRKAEYPSHRPLSSCSRCNIISYPGKMRSTSFKTGGIVFHQMGGF